MRMIDSNFPKIVLLYEIKISLFIKKNSPIKMDMDNTINSILLIIHILTIFLLYFYFIEKICKNEIIIKLIIF